MEKTLESIEKANEKLRQGKEIGAKLEMASGIIRNIRFGNLARYLSDVIRHSDYRSLNDMHHNMIMIGSMHFMDPYNFDLERVQRCVIHYATPDGTIIPFCTMNNLHKQEIEKRYAKPFSLDKTTPLYDVQSLVRRIRLEDEFKEHNQQLDELNHIVINENR
ncbi:hypothetical protein E4H04_09385 [Candidatus Bathyarchaeota archaeon]|nr:MAG: hypothetical protein E4H04_09385 [Candidatus Bathyarchaeota archaeon]